jgi:hypothetical protein
VRTGVQATEQAVTFATQVIRSVTPDGSAAAPERAAPRSARAQAPADVELATPPPPAEVYAESTPVTAAAPSTPEAPTLSAEPVHVSEEPTVVEEFAEPGAEDGAGAEVNIAEPWEAYTRMGAKDVISRLADASPAELAAVQLYESANKKRETVIAAAARELRTKSGPGAATADHPRKEQPNG